MLFWITIKTALRALWANKMRSALAMLGIIIGVGAVIAMLAMGAGAQAKVVKFISAMGTNLLMVGPTQRGSGGVMSGTQQNLTLADAQAIMELEGVAAISPVVRGNAQVKFLNQNSRTNVTGVSSTYLEIRNFEIGQGRMFTEQEAESVGRVAVIGPVTAENLFGKEPPLGESIKINGTNFKVVGVTKSKGDQGFMNPDDQVLVPYTTAMKLLFGQDYLREINILAAEGTDLSALSGQPPGQGGFGPPRQGVVHETPPPEGSVTALLRKRHKLNDQMPDDFRIQNQAEMLETMSGTVLVFRILLGSIAAISLLVGGIGIMNIMLVTVTERTREIGVRKAIGAKGRDILSQFLIESVLMSGLGGSVGATLGIVSSWLIAYFVAKNPASVIPAPVVQAHYVILSISVSAIVGIFFGVYPAWKASRLDPIEALRYE